MGSTSYAGKMTPVILLPRFTTLVGGGGQEFLTLPIDVTAFESARVTLWRAGVQGTSSPTATFFFDESTDRDTWTYCPSTSPTGETIAVNEEHVESFPMGRKWFRLRGRIDGTNPAVTCWAQGFFIRRQR